MKKVLLATTALGLSAGVAAADVTVGGTGRMGIIYNEDGFANNFTGSEQSYDFTSRIRIEFTASGETDGGLAFGGSIRADNAAGGNIGTEGNVFISGEFGKLSMGDVDGGAEIVVGDLAFVSLTGLGDFNETLYTFGANDPNALYEYSAGGLTLALGLSDDDEYSAGVGYDGGIWSVGLGYEKLPEGGNVSRDIDGETVVVIEDVSDTVHQLIGAAAVTFSNITLKGMYGNINVDEPGQDNLDQWGLSAEGVFGATTVAAFYHELQGLEGAVGAVSGETIGEDNLQYYGIGAEYDLGGGASVAAGLASVYDISDNDNKMTADFGVKFAF